MGVDEENARRRRARELAAVAVPVAPGGTLRFLDHEDPQKPRWRAEFRRD